MFETSENHVKDVYSQQAESGELSQFQPISSGKMAITHNSKVEKKVEKRVGRIPSVPASLCILTCLLCIHHKFKPYANLMIMSGNNHTLKINLTTKYGERKK